MDPVLFDIFESECREHLRTLAELVEYCHRGPGPCPLPEDVARAFHTLHGSAHMAGVEPMAKVGSALEHLANELRLQGIPADERVIEVIQDGQLLIARLLEIIPAPERELPDTEGFLSRVAELQGGLLVEQAALREQAKADTEPGALDTTYTEVSGDPELIEIFLEEAKDLLELLDASLRQWRANPSDSSVLVELQRTLHTLKGGARLAGIMPIGDLSHAYETLLSGVVSGEVQPSAEVLDLAQDTADWLSSQVEEVATTQRVKSGDALVDMLEAVRAGRLASAPPESVPESAAEAAEAFAPRELRRPHQEQIRVRADLLDRLVNNAGEVSIYRSRIEQQTTSIGFNLQELEQTVERLRIQLRKLEIETETQILFRFERDRDPQQDFHEDFDPLELDRFSTMQQLSRSLMETVNDLVNIKDVMEELNRANETLLLQQARVSTDLQDGLLRTRMVPFGQVVPRLHRLVRQTAKSVGKQATLDVYGASEELDRNILERILAPLEHILRNAVSHGIEHSAERRAADKPETGRISIYVGRDGTDVVLNVADDGAGMNLDAIRRRAIERGLLKSSVDVSDDDVMQFVLTSGFSTAAEVTQVAGRGVGMDVVASGIKQLGGSLEMGSQPGRGTRFAIRLPLTLAISEALLAQVGEEIYAIPYASIEGVVRISKEQLQELYRDNHSIYSYAGHDYHVRHLGGMLGTAAVNLAEGVRWFPVLLVRSGDRRVALQVDGLLGNRQIVVKTVGPQLSSIHWITGATILGDGRVALILDLNAMIRLDAAKTIAPDLVPGEAPEQARVTVMVVDDSITVRKVTTRLLERHNMTVISAKDGMDAVTKLQERVPDIMLLDIEMPRMDGFEVARHIRNTEELKQVPIVMITSRTGEKHRQRALELGVQRYLGKPYQETELLSNIYSVLSEVST
jgi:chemosensory pili system protein ChpA (sensor histidine kinase/response regulator)